MKQIVTTEFELKIYSLIVVFELALLVDVLEAKLELISNLFHDECWSKNAISLVAVVLVVEVDAI